VEQLRSGSHARSPAVSANAWQWAAAIVRQPQVFLMDEPLSNLTRSCGTARPAARLLNDLDDDDLVTHDQVEALTMGMRGRDAERRAAAGRQPATPLRPARQPFVGGFIGSPAMNMVEATLVSSNGTLVASVGSQRLVLGEQKLNAHPGCVYAAGASFSVQPGGPEMQRCRRAHRPTAGSAAELFSVRRSAPRSSRTSRSTPLPALTGDVRELAADVGEELTDQALERRWSAFDARSGVRQAAGRSSVDTRALHFFDPATGAGIYDTDSNRS
jgi:multiple sugar transport system ATP-binding protein